MKFTFAASCLLTALSTSNTYAFVPSSLTCSAFVSSNELKNDNKKYLASKAQPVLLRMSDSDSVTATATVTKDEPETFEFKAEVGRVMDIIINSLYSNREVFLRELTSNASDACDKKRFLSLSSEKTLTPPEIRIKPDKVNNVLIIEDSGVGITRDELVANLGSIAQSGTKKFLDALGSDNKDATNLIGQFGVGFYSAYLIADKVTVISKSMTDNSKVYKWESSAGSHGTYSISEVDASEFEGDSGTKLMLHVKEDALEFLESNTISNLLNKYSEFVEFPISLYQEKTDYQSVPDVEANKDLAEGDEPKMKTIPVTTEGFERLNNQKPIWVRSPSDVTDEEYTDFYKTAFKAAYDEPMAHSHFALEGSVECKSLIYVPGMLPFELSRDMFDEDASSIRLYVKRVFINDKFDGIIPRWLKFIRGVVDSNDLPLNVGREILQRTKALTVIRKRLVRKSLDMIREIERDEDESKYIMFWNNFGKYMKVGIIEDEANKKDIAPLLRFYSSTSAEEYRSFDEYITDIKPNQKSIYYLTADSQASAAKSPVLEKLSKKGFEVLFMVEPLDEITIQNLETYKDYKIQDITKEGIDVFDEEEEDSEDGEEKEEKKAKQEKLTEDFKATTEFLEALLQGKINKAQVTSLLVSSPAALVQGAYGMSPTMQRYMKAQTVATTGSSQFPGSDNNNQAILEINPDNVIVQDLQRMIAEDDPEKENFGMLLYDVAAMSSGYDLEDVNDFSKRVMKMMNPKAVPDDEIAINEEEDDEDEEIKDVEVNSKVVQDDEVTDDDDDDDDDVKVVKDVEVL